MEVDFKRFDDQKLLEARIRVTELASEAQIGLVIDAYRAALDEIAPRLVASDSYYFGITLSVKKGLIKVKRSGVSLRAARLIATNKTYWPVRNPWTAVSPEFWLVAWQFPALRNRIDVVLNNIEDMLAVARQNDAGSDAYWEDETTGFGEPLVTLLALEDRRLVDAYRRLMNQWDMHHEFQQLEVIELIVRTHGIGLETEQLLYDRATISIGQNGEEQIAALMPLLDQAYGSFTESSLFERIVA